MTLATADATGAPSARMVLLKGVDARGFQFFTNYDSRKGRELTENPRAALCWHWAWLEMQVRAEGAIERLGAAESDLGRAIPRPPHWGGFLLRPHAIEFWQGKKSRLHERRRFTLDAGAWRCERLSP